MEEVEENIIEMYENLKEVATSFKYGELKNHQNFMQLIREFSEPVNKWRYYYEFDLPQLLKKTLAILKKFRASKDLRMLGELEKFSGEILSELRSCEQTEIIYDQQVIEKEIVLQYKLRLVDKVESADEKLLSLNDNLDSLKKEFNAILERNKYISSSQKEAKRIIDDLKNKNAAYSQIIDEDSNRRIQKYYEDIYAEEIKIANKYRKWALWIFAAVGSFLLIGFLIVSIQNWNHLRNPSFIEIKLGWDSLFKTLMLFSLTTPAWYLTKESSKHRQVAYKAKMLGTELAAFPLYAREFKDEERLELRKSLADRFFGQELYGSSTPKEDNSSSTEQIKLLAEMNKVTVEAIKVQQTLLGKKE